MADRTLKAGDTWPSLRGKAQDGNGVSLDLSGADLITVLIKHSSGSPLLTKTATAIDPLTNDGYNWVVAWNETDTEIVGTYKVETEVEWDNATTPPKVQTFPNTGTNELVIEDDLGGVE